MAEALSVKNEAGRTPIRKPEVTSVAQRSTGMLGEVWVLREDTNIVSGSTRPRAIYARNIVLTPEHKEQSAGEAEFIQHT